MRSVPSVMDGLKPTQRKALCRPERSPIPGIDVMMTGPVLLLQAQSSVRCEGRPVGGLRWPGAQALHAQETRAALLAFRAGEHSAYHHGESSLAATIVSMAQDFDLPVGMSLELEYSKDFVGSNNLNLLVPSDSSGHEHRVERRIDCSSAVQFSGTTSMCPGRSECSLHLHQATSSFQHQIPQSISAG